MLVILEDAGDLERLARGGLDLADAPHLVPHDGHGPPTASARRWVVTSARGGLLYEAWTLRQTLELEPSDRERSPN